MVQHDGRERAIHSIRTIDTSYPILDKQFNNIHIFAAGIFGYFNFKEWRAIAEDRSEWTYSKPMPPFEN